MHEPDLLELFAAPLNSAGIGYMITGSVASTHYGQPRVTLDIDMVLALEPGQPAAWRSLFPESDYYLPPEDVIELERRRETRGHFNVIHHPSGLKADFYTSRAHPLWGWAVRNRRSIQVSGQTYWFAPPEYVILHKLEFLREGGGDRHVSDIRAMLKLCPYPIDIDFVDQHAHDLGLNVIWKKVTTP